LRAISAMRTLREQKEVASDSGGYPAKYLTG
jgi:hypothetical protein